MFFPLQRLFFPGSSRVGAWIIYDSRNSKVLLELGRSAGAADIYNISNSKVLLERQEVRLVRLLIYNSRNLKVLLELSISRAWFPDLQQ